MICRYDAETIFIEFIRSKTKKMHFEMNLHYIIQLFEIFQIFLKFFRVKRTRLYCSICMYTYLPIRNYDYDSYEQEE